MLYLGTYDRSYGVVLIPVKSVLAKESINAYAEWYLGGTNASYEGSAIYVIAMTAPAR